MDYSNHHCIGSHINIQMQTVDNSSRAQAYRAPRMPRVTETFGTDAVDVASRIHFLEKAAYSAVLRAFVAQSDVLSWAKEGLITELRRELNVTDKEHQELLAEIKSDESVKMIRDRRKSTFHAQELPLGRMDSPGFVPSSVGSARHGTLKTSHADVATLQRYFSHGQPTLACNPSFPVHCRDGQKTGELSTYSIGNAGKSMKVVISKVKIPTARKRRVTVKPHSKKGLYVADVDNVRKRSDIIEIRATDRLLNKVKSMVYGKETPDPDQIEKAKSILKEHEGSILAALGKLANVSDGDDSAKQGMMHKEFHGGGGGGGNRVRFH